MPGIIDQKIKVVEEYKNGSEAENYRVCEVRNPDGTLVGKSMGSAKANYLFNYQTGQMVTWGATSSEDAVKFPAPNILDMEITTICGGPNGKGCPFCYKSNTRNGKNMSLETFRHILDVFPRTLTQIALGADYDLTTNPDIWEMMAYTRQKGIVPNVTAGFCNDETADRLVQYCGAVAISCYGKDACYDSIKRLTDRGLKQTNMHFMIAEETFEKAMSVLKDIHTDPRLARLNAIVFLSLKQKGRGTGYHPLSEEKFKQLTDYAQEHHISLGFDSCSSLKAIRALGTDIKSCVMDCESSLESSYINVEGQYFPCSFCERGLWTEGLDVLACRSSEDFIKDIWNNPKTEKFRQMLLNTAHRNEHNCRECPVFTI